MCVHNGVTFRGGGGGGGKKKWCRYVTMHKYAVFELNFIFIEFHTCIYINAMLFS